ncbi:hypothetical protein, partial [Streptomyces sp. NPDC002159]
WAISDNTCEFCRAGLHTSCAHPQANFWDGEAVHKEVQPIVWIAFKTGLRISDVLGLKQNCNC